MELGEYGITVNALIPGLIGTALTRHEDRDAQAIEVAGGNPTGDETKDEKTAMDGLAKKSPLGMPTIDPRDVAAMVVFLASDEARMASGGTLFDHRRGQCLHSELKNAPSNPLNGEAVSSNATDTPAVEAVKASIDAILINCPRHAWRASHSEAISYPPDEQYSIRAVRSSIPILRLGRKRNCHIQAAFPPATKLPGASGVLRPMTTTR